MAKSTRSEKPYMLVIKFKFWWVVLVQEYSVYSCLKPLVLFVSRWKTRFQITNTIMFMVSKAKKSIFLFKTEKNGSLIVFFSWQHY